MDPDRCERNSGRGEKGNERYGRCARRRENPRACPVCVARVCVCIIILRRGRNLAAVGKYRPEDREVSFLAVLEQLDVRRRCPAAVFDFVRVAGKGAALHRVAVFRARLARCG